MKVWLRQGPSRESFWLYIENGRDAHLIYKLRDKIKSRKFTGKPDYITLERLKNDKAMGAIELGSLLEHITKSGILNDPFAFTEKKVNTMKTSGETFPEVTICDVSELKPKKEV